MDDDLLQEFLAESWENLARLDDEIVRLEKSPGDAELLASIFRTIHTIKGTCGFLGLTRLGGVAHSAEEVLGGMREGRLAVTADAISLVLRAVDAIKELLRHLEATKAEPETDHSDLVAALDAFGRHGGAAAPPPAAPPAPDLTPTPAAAVPPSAPRDAVPEEVAAAETGRSVADASIRVHVDTLDRLMNLVGELVLARNQLLQLVRGEDESRYASPVALLNRVTTDLQEGVMKTRMQPVGNAWSKLPRLARDLEQLTGKRFNLEMTGGETDLDRTVLEAIKDPLTHMVRNAADHAIEPPDARRAAGKPERGTIRLEAYHEGGHVIISLTDDGRGIDPARVAAKAVERGLISQADAGRMGDRELIGLIFRPGFSTAETVSSVSGRGVGMDVVKTAVERIGGTIDLQSVVGRGTTVRIRIPLTLAIISAVIVRSGRETFAIPQLAVTELVRLPADERHRVERVYDREVFRLRDRLLPLVHLDAALGLSDPAAAADDLTVAVVQVGDDRLGLVVSEVFDTEEIVVKPVGRLLKDIPIYQGTTILGDGRVILILDVAGLAAESGALRPAGGRAEEPAADADDEKTPLLVFTSGTLRLAVPLSLVARLEEFPAARIERGGGRMVVQYRGGLLPLFPVAGADPAIRDPQPVVVFTDGDQALGLLVDTIEDIVEERLTARLSAARPGVLGAAVVGGRATDLLDTRHYLLQAAPDWFERGRPAERRRVLAVDDSPFFRQLIRAALEAEGYEVVTAAGGPQGLAAFDRGDRFDAVVSDLEMPGMDGFRFAAELRARPDAADVPLVAISAMPPRLAEARAKTCGFDAFLQKFDAAGLVATLGECRQRRQLAATGGRP